MISQLISLKCDIKRNRKYTMPNRHKPLGSDDRTELTKESGGGRRYNRQSYKEIEMLVVVIY